MVPPPGRYGWAAPGLQGDLSFNRKERRQIILEDYTDGDVLTVGIKTTGIRSRQDTSVGSYRNMSPLVEEGE